MGGAIHTIKSADQQTADFVSEKDVKARSKAEQKQSKSRAKAEQKQSKSRAKAEQKQDSRLGPICLIYGDQTVGGVGAENPVGSKAAAALLLI
ncbi:hypothetical protein [Pseudomonas sp. Irchel 3H9]|uniref:hypothetical protein n=1 Tax=Pseudomonas sp. Irchel 3H9 TaxID=2009043 RepID=UPI000BA4E134|nr:hypothetical protein [Pseudomonas sp. Irchel 3H9]